MTIPYRLCIDFGFIVSVWVISGYFRRFVGQLVTAQRLNCGDCVNCKVFCVILAYCWVPFIDPGWNSRLVAALLHGCVMLYPADHVAAAGKAVL